MKNLINNPPYTIKHHYDNSVNYEKQTNHVVSVHHVFFQHIEFNVIAITTIINNNNNNNSIYINTIYFSHFRKHLLRF